MPPESFFVKRDTWYRSHGTRYPRGLDIQYLCVNGFGCFVFYSCCCITIMRLELGLFKAGSLLLVASHKTGERTQLKQHSSKQQQLAQVELFCLGLPCCLHLVSSPVMQLTA